MRYRPGLIVCVSQYVLVSQCDLMNIMRDYDDSVLTEVGIVLLYTPIGRLVYRNSGYE